jgi:hypothetical protein
VITAIHIDGARIHTDWHDGVFLRLLTGEFAEGSYPRRIGVTPDYLREQPHPQGPSSRRSLSAGATSNTAVLQTTMVNSRDREMAASKRHGLRINRVSWRTSSGSEIVPETAMMSRWPPFRFSAAFR